MRLRTVFCGVALLLASGVARADRLIWIPTAYISGFQAEYMFEADGGRGVGVAQFGIGKKFELLGRYYSDFLPDDEFEVGGQFQVLPEGIATPAVAIGVWDVADDGPRGRRFFGVLSKAVPIVNKLPLGMRDIKGHVGLGSDSLATLFFGGQVGFPFGLRLYAEFDSDEFNPGISWDPIRMLRLKLENWDDDVFIGAQFISPL